MGNSTEVVGLFDGYARDGFFDEVFDAHGRCELTTRRCWPAWTGSPPTT